MAVRPVVQIPDLVLSGVATPVGRIDDEARALAVDLIDTMRASPACVGLAAPQIGVARRAFAVDVSGHKKAVSCHGEFVLFDPEVVSTEAPELAREGCMSVPDLTVDVMRSARVTVAGTTPAGERMVIEADAFEARALLHEIDHLDGLVILDRAAGPHAVFARKVYR